MTLVEYVGRKLNKEIYEWAKFRGLDPFRMDDKEKVYYHSIVTVRRYLKKYFDFIEVGSEDPKGSFAPNWEFIAHLGSKKLHVLCTWSGIEVWGA